MWQPTATETMAIYHWNKSEFCYREREMPGEVDTVFALNKHFKSTPNISFKPPFLTSQEMWLLRDFIEAKVKNTSLAFNKKLLQTGYF